MCYDSLRHSTQSIIERKFELDFRKTFQHQNFTNGLKLNGHLLESCTTEKFYLKTFPDLPALKTS
jgi:hypothetical protein